MLTYTDLFPDEAHHEPCTLTAVADAIADAIAHSLPPRLWVVAEVAQVQVHGAGHCYMELVERGPKGQIVAKMRASLWRATYMALHPRFEAVVGGPLAVGMQVMLEAEVTHHAQYGLSLNVVGLNAHYTVAQVMHRRQTIIDQLAKDGILHDNRGLELPPVLGRIAVISSDTAAGYGDFMTHLAQHAKAYNLEVCLFPAAMQGERTEAEVVQALQRIEAEAERWDAVVIIRGGGATTDLEGFDSYLIGAAIAQSALPVLCGIGHERDYTVVDEVAHTRLKTPTAVAEFIVAHFRTAHEALRGRYHRLYHHVQTTLQRATTALDRQRTAMGHAFGTAIATRSHALHTQHLRLAHGLQQRLATHHATLEQRHARLAQAVHTRLQKATAHLQLAEKQIDLVRPERILALGYTLTTCEGRTLRSCQGLKAGDRLVTRLLDGTVESVVE